jgi:hypothetical protein
LNFADLRFADQTFLCFADLKLLQIRKYMLIEVDLLAACMALREVVAVFVIFLWRWRTICTVLQPMGSKG